MPTTLSAPSRLWQLGLARSAGRLGALVDRPSAPQGGHYAGSDLYDWARRTVEKVRVASVGGRLRFLPWVDTYTDETPEMRREYRVMLREPAVKAGFLSKVIPVASEELQFQPENEEDPREQEAAKFCSYAFRKLRGSTRRLGWSVLHPAVIDGHSVSEKVWEKEPIPYGRWKGKRKLRVVKAKDTHFLLLGTDPYRNVTAVKGTGFNAGRVWSPSDFLIFSYYSLFESPSGLSDFRAAYRAYWIKDTAWKLRTLHLENFTGPYLHGTYATQEQKAALESAFEEARAGTWLTVPVGVLVETIDLSMKGTSDFKDAIADCDREVLVAIAGSHLQNMEGQSGSGRHGDTRVHKEVGEVFQWWLASALADAYQEQLVVPLVEENYHGVEPPSVTVGAVTDADMLQKAQVYKAIEEIGLDLSKKACYRSLSVQPPDPDDEDDVLRPPGQGGPGGPEGAPPAGKVGPPGGPGEGGGEGGSPFAEFSEADWAAFASASAARAVGEKWQGPSGKWFTKRPDGRVVPTAAPDAAGGKGKPGPAPKQPTRAELARQKREAAAKAKADAKAKAEREKARAAAKEKARQEQVVTAIGEMVRGERKPTAVAVRQAGEVLLTMKADQLKALAAELGTRKSGAKQALVDAVLARARAGKGGAGPAGGGDGLAAKILGYAGVLDVGQGHGGAKRGAAGAVADLLAGEKFAGKISPEDVATVLGENDIIGERLGHGGQSLLLDVPHPSAFLAVLTAARTGTYGGNPVTDYGTLSAAARHAAGAPAGKPAPPPKPAPTPPKARAAPKPKLPPLDLPEVPPLPPPPDPSGVKRLPPPAQVPDGPVGERLRAAPHLHEAARQMAALHERGEALRNGEARLWAQAAVLGQQAQAEFAAAGAARRVTAASKERSERGKQLLARSGELRQRAGEFRAALDGHARQCRDRLHAVAGVPPGLRAGIGDHDFDASSDPVRPVVDGATAFLTPLLGQGAAQQHLPGFRVVVRADDARPHYQNRDRSINGGTKDLRPEIAAHEMAHGIEYGMAGAQAACNEFLEHRLKGERPAELRSLPGGEKYDPGEKGAKDDFDRYFAGTSAYYVGKRYAGGATEVLSMGVQALYEDPAKFAAKDPEYFAFTLGVLRGELRSGRRHLPDDDEISLSRRG